MRFVWLFTGIILCTFRTAAQSQFVPEQLLSQYVQIPSVTGNEAPAARFLLDVCQQSGLQTFVFNDEPNSFNFAASLYPLEKGKPNIIFHTHCDVVHEGDSSKWTYPPYSGMIADSAVWGRGSLDNKGLAIMQLMALCQFTDTARNADLPFNVTMLVVSNEEEGGHLGAGRVLSRHYELLHPAVVYGEGGAGLSNVLFSDPARIVYGISIQHKQGIWLDIGLKNRGCAHGAIASCDNMNSVLVEALHQIVHQKKRIKVTDASALMVKELSKYEKGMVRCAYRHPRLFFPLLKKRILQDPLLSLIFTDTYTLTNIHSSQSSINSVADEVHAILDCRFLEAQNTNELVLDLKEKMKQPAVAIKIIKSTPAALQTVPDRYFNWMKEAVLQNDSAGIVVPVFFPAISDNNHFRNYDIPTYGFVPCIFTADQISRIHNFNEHLPTASLYQGIDIYSRFIRIALKSSNE